MAEAQIGGGGMGYSSFGGGLIGGLRSQAQLDKFGAGLAAQQQAYNNLLQGRQSYFGGGIGLAQTQNQADVNRGLGIAGLESQNAGMLNNFNSNIYGQQSQNTANQNSFNQGNYGYQLQNQAYNNQNGFNRALGIGSLGLGAFQLGGNLVSRFMGGSSPSSGIGSFPQLSSPGINYPPLLSQGIGGLQ